MRSFIDLVRRVLMRYLADDCATRSASIAYFALASLFPAILLMLTLLGHFVSTAQAQERVVEIVGYYLPVPGIKGFVLDNLHAVLEWRSVMGMASVAVLMWSSKGTFLAAERGLNAVWRMQRPRHTVSAYFISIAVTLVLGGLLVVQFSLIALLRTVVTWEVPFLGYSLEGLSAIWSMLSYLVSPLMLFGLFVLLYTGLPRERMPLRPVLWGAVFAAASYRLVESGFILYITYVAHITVLYGAASGLILLMLWLYLSSNIFFVGAELIYEMANPQEPIVGVGSGAWAQPPDA